MAGEDGQANWLYLGKEMMKLLMVFTLIPRIIAIPATFIFVKSASDLEVAMYLQEANIDC